MPERQVLLPLLFGKRRAYPIVAPSSLFFAFSLFWPLLELGKPQKRGWVRFWSTVLHASWIFRSDRQEEAVSNCFSKDQLAAALTPCPEKTEQVLQRTFFILHVRRIFLKSLQS